MRPRARAYYRATATTTRGSIARAVAAHDDDAGGVRRAEVRARGARSRCALDDDDDDDDDDDGTGRRAMRA